MMLRQIQTLKRILAERLSGYLALACLLLPCMLSAALAQTPLAGTPIDNRASARYVDSVTGVATILQSNVVTVIVQPVEALTLEHAQSLKRPPGAAVQMPHRLTNHGNVTTLYALTAFNETGDDFDLDALKVHVDSNGNGLADAGEAVVTSLSVAPDESVDIVVSAVMPGSAGSGQAKIRVRAVSTSASAQNINTVTAVDAAVIAMLQSVSDNTPAAGSMVRLSLNARNIGKDSAWGSSVSVDGVASNLVIVQMPIPVNTGFVSASPVSGARLLFHLVTMPAMSFTETQPADLASVDSIAYAFDVLPAGSGFLAELNIHVNDNAAGTSGVAALASYQDGMTPAISSSHSNMVMLTVLPYVNLRIYSGPDFLTEVNHVKLGAVLYVQANAAACNHDIAKAETALIRLSTKNHGDEETFVATETGTNTGVFRIGIGVPTLNDATNAVLTGDGALETERGDWVTALLPDCGGGPAEAKTLIDPAGVVFDSRSNAPVAGITVRLIDVTGGGNGGMPGGAARVYAADGVTPAPDTVITGADGFYQFPVVDPSTYRLVLDAPGYAFPSHVVPANLPAGRAIDPSGSYGGDFVITLATVIAMIDVPVDSPTGGLTVEVASSRSVAELGDVVDYTVRVRNISGVLLPQVALNLALPPGFSLQTGSLRRDGSALADPSTSAGALSAPLGSLANDGMTQLNYRARIGPTTPLGNALTSAQAINRTPFLGSNIGTALVRVEGGVFDNKAFVLGRIYADCNRNGMQDEGELGVPGVRIWLEDGTWAISDGEGKYSFYGLSPRTHVAKVDATTLPVGAHLAALDQRNGMDGGSRFLDMKNGELQRADFAIGNCTPGIMAEVQARRARAQRANAEVVTAAQSPLRVDEAPAAPGSAIASGTIGGTQPTPVPQTPASPQLKKATVLPLPVAIAGLDSKLDFIGIPDRMVMTANRATLRVKGPGGGSLRLRANGIAIADSHVGMRIEQPEPALQASEYVGVELQVGENLLELEHLDAQGKVLDVRRVVLIAPGVLTRIVVEPVAAALADGSDSARIVVRLEDANGVLVSSRTALTLEADAGEWLSPDVDARETGTQVFLEGGRGEFLLRSPQNPGDVRLRISSGTLTTDSVASFLPPLRDLVAVGVVEGVLSRRKLSAGALQRSGGNDGFEQEIEHFSKSAGSNTAAARTALFLKGKVRGDYLLTLAYDSDQDTKERLFRDIQPDKFYPVYGDDSVKGFDAQSTGHLYVRIDRNKSWLLYGDFLTSNATMDPARQLAAYNRSLNGLRQHYENGRIAVDSFASRQASRQKVDEFPANGTSGPFSLVVGNIVVNSERVEIITRDRTQHSQILKVVPLARFSDYTLEPFSGSLLLSAPVPSVDANLNDNSIRITYEIDEGGAQYWVGGTDVRVKLIDNDKVSLQAGVVAVEDRDPKDSSRLQGASVTFKSGDVTAIGETARTTRDSVGSGTAQRLDIRKERGDLQGQVYIGRSDQAFNNPSSALNQGRNEYGGKLSYALDERTRAVAAAKSTRDDSRGTRRKEAQVGIERSFDNKLKLELALRQYSETSGSRAVDGQETTSMRAKLSAPMPGVTGATIFGEIEQAVGDTERRMIAFGGDYRLSPKTRMYGRYELVSSLGSYVDAETNRRNTAVFGIDSEYLNNGRAFSEYRARDAFDGREAEAAMGLRNKWNVAEGLALNTSFERVHALEGRDHARRVAATAVTGAAEYTRNPDRKLTGRLEWRTSEINQSVLNTLGYAHRLNSAWTLLVRNIFNVVDSKTTDSGDRRQERFQVGAAYRGVAGNPWNALGRYEYKNERDSTPASGYVREVHIVSTHANVKLSRATVLSGRYAGKHAQEESAGMTSKGTMHLIATRATHDIFEKWDASLQLSRLFAPGTGSAQTGIGIELGHLMLENLWLSLGYNFRGFRDRDLTAGEDTERGAFLRLRFKFDEKLFEQF